MKPNSSKLLVLLVVLVIGLIAATAANAEAPPVAADAAVAIGDAAPENDVEADEPAAPASPVAIVEADPIGAVKVVLDSAREGNWKLVTAFVLALLMSLLGKFRDKVKWFKGDRGGAVLVMVLGIAGGISTALAVGAKFDLALLTGAFSTALLAAGGYSWFKKLIWPSDQGKEAPNWIDYKPEPVKGGKKKRPSKAIDAKGN